MKLSNINGTINNNRVGISNHKNTNQKITFGYKLKDIAGGIGYISADHANNETLKRLIRLKKIMTFKNTEDLTINIDYNRWSKPKTSYVIKICSNKDSFQVTRKDRNLITSFDEAFDLIIKSNSKIKKYFNK